MTDADRIAAIVRKAEANCCTVTVDEIRWLADRADRQLTVGAALALPEVQSGACVVEYRNGPWRQLGFDGVRVFSSGRWSKTSDRMFVEAYALPARAVPLAEADANPATRGEMP